MGSSTISCFPNNTTIPFRVRSLVGLIPLYAIERLEDEWIKPFPIFRENMKWFLENRKDLVERSVSKVVLNGPDHLRACRR